MQLSQLVEWLRSARRLAERNFLAGLLAYECNYGYIVRRRAVGYGPMEGHKSTEPARLSDTT